MSDFLQLGDFFGLTKWLYMRKASQNLPASLRNNISSIYAIIRQSMSSFGNKPLVTLNWSSKSGKCHRRLPNYDQGERIRDIYFFVKNITINIVPHNLSILINILFCIFFLLFCLHHRTFAKFVRTKGFSKWILIHSDTSSYI